MGPLSPVRVVCWIPCVFTLLITIPGTPAQVLPTTGEPTIQVAPKASLNSTFKSSAQGTLHATVHNPTSDPGELRLPAGTIFQSEEGGRLVSYRTVLVNIPAGETLDLEIPAVAVSSRAKQRFGAYNLTADHLPELNPFWSFLAT